MTGSCLPSGVTAYMSGAINVLTDAFVVLLPLRAILKMNMVRSQKFRALAVFGLGFMYAMRPHSFVFSGTIGLTV